uniref:Small RNA 2'-O-methyltransferase n=1 Tax=Haemonchus contortus TaxID=6289 RepID=A0A7I4YBZ9_HAECO
MADSMSCRFSDDGWPIQYDFDRILHSYELIYDEVERNPVEATVEEAPMHMYDYDEVISKPRIFTPPLQYQRNAFVRDILYTYMEDAGEKIRKLAVLGCGSMSLERFLVALMGSMGIERVVSVDIDENELAKGLKLLNLAETQNENVICNSNSLPVLLDVYKGDILEYDERLAGAGCVCSTEVIEHIPKEDAARYVRSVLLNIRPQLFIISTPNHEYNEVFGMAQGQFRHADHKFEFTRQQFKNWLFEILSDFLTDYEYTVKYVGNVQGYNRFGGATQFGIIRRKRNEIITMLPHSCSRPYKKVGELVVENSFFPLEREKVRQAFILWLQENPLLQENLIKSYIGEFWRVCMTAVLKNIELPAQLKKRLDKKTLVDVLRFQCNGRVIYETYDGEIYLNIPHNVTKDELIEIMTSKSS